MDQSADFLGPLLGLGLTLLAVLSLFFLAVAIVVCWLLYGCFKRVPAEHRKLSPGLVWLLLIPCFAIVWNFFVYPKLAQSYRSYFAAAGKTDVGDCGEMLAWAFAICAAVSVIPIPVLGIVAAVAAVVLWILFIVKALSLKGQIPA